MGALAGRRRRRLGRRPPRVVLPAAAPCAAGIARHGEHHYMTVTYVTPPLAPRGSLNTVSTSAGGLCEVFGGGVGAVPRYVTVTYVTRERKSSSHSLHDRYIRYIVTFFYLSLPGCHAPPQLYRYLLTVIYRYYASLPRLAQVVVY